MRAIAAALALIACALLLAACGGGSSAPVIGPDEAVEPGVGPGAGDKVEALAKDDVERRLVAAPLPPGSREVAELPASFELEGAPFVPVTPDLVEAHALFVVPMELPRALAWIRSHPPENVTPERLESGGGTDSGLASQTLGFSWPEPGALGERELYETVVARPGGGSALRLDAQVTWGDAGTTAAGESAPGAEADEAE
jgi:hypothetical protein